MASWWLLFRPGVFLLFQVASAICRLNSFTIHKKSRWAYCVSRLERIISGSVRLKIVSLKPQHMWSHNNNLPGTEYFNCCLSSSSSLKVTWRDFVCQCGPSRRGRCGLLLFNSADVVHAPTRREKHTTTERNRKKRLTLPYMVKRRIYSRRLPRRREKPTAAPPSRLVTYIFFGYYFTYIFRLPADIELCFRHSAFWQITINLLRGHCVISFGNQLSTRLNRNKFQTEMNDVTFQTWWLTSHYLHHHHHRLTKTWQPWENKRYWRFEIVTHLFGFDNSIGNWGKPFSLLVYFYLVIIKYPE